MIPLPTPGEAAPQTARAASAARAGHGRAAEAERGQDASFAAFSLPATPVEPRRSGAPDAATQGARGSGAQAGPTLPAGRFGPLGPAALGAAPLATAGSTAFPAAGADAAPGREGAGTRVAGAVFGSASPMPDGQVSKGTEVAPSARTAHPLPAAVPPGGEPSPAQDRPLPDTAGSMLRSPRAANAAQTAPSAPPLVPPAPPSPAPAVASLTGDATRWSTPTDGDTGTTAPRAPAAPAPAAAPAAHAGAAIGPDTTAPAELRQPPPPLPGPVPTAPAAPERVAVTGASQPTVASAELGTEAALPMPATGGEPRARLATTMPDLPGAIGAAKARATAASSADPGSAATVAGQSGAQPAQAPGLTATMPAATPDMPVVESALRQIAGAITSEPGSGVIELRLDPPELGRVEIILDFADDGLKATVSAERSATAEALRRHGEMLLAQLRDAGFATVDLDFGAFHDSGDRPGGRADAQPESTPWRSGERDGRGAVLNDGARLAAALRFSGSDLALDLKV